VSPSAGRWRPPEHYVHGHGEVVVVPARVAAWLMKYAHLDRLRAQVRGADPEVDSVLVALTVAGMHWRTSATGSTRAPEAEVVAPSPWMGTTQVADSLGITARAVRLAISEERLPAESVDGRWLIRREDVEHYRASRRAA
jgi:excisionase family DNA binding protein